MKTPFLLLLFITIFISITCTTKEGEVMNFEPSLGSIFVSSTAPGARIFLDYKDTGKLTPDLLNNIKKGEHIVHIFLSNYISSPDSFLVTVEEGKETTVTFEVTNVPNVGNLVVNTDPDSALVKINKLEFGYSPLLVSGLLQGKYKIRIEKSGFATIDTSAVVIQNRVAQIFATLTLDLKRLVLFEHFSNTDCVPCVGVDEIFEEVLDSLGPEFVSRVGYHPNVPSASDPFYQEAKTENDTRKSYYSVPFSPYAVLDGAIFQITSLSQLKQDLLDALNA
ncbi:MAG: PEGA domain-containing protein, partial [Calditrichia bacterium]